MVEVKYVDGDEEVFETKNCAYPYWTWLKDEQAYFINSIDGDIVIPSGFIKRLKHIEVEV